MRRRTIKLDQYGISRWRYEELRAFCRQYDEKKHAAAAMLGPKTRKSKNETEHIVIKREQLIRDVEMIEKAAKEVGDGSWYAALILNCCQGVSYSRIPAESMPTSNNAAYFKARREFFFRLALARP